MTPHDLHLALSALGQALASVGIGLAIGGAIWWWCDKGTNHAD